MNRGENKAGYYKTATRTNQEPDKTEPGENSEKHYRPGRRERKTRQYIDLCGK